jgi:hypothetical protein
MNKYIESITQIETALPNYIIRVWRQENDYTQAIEETTQQEIEKVLKGVPWPLTRKQIADALFEIDRVNAVEVKLQGNGVVMYKNWP